MRLIVGLGNPGDRYASTRHNIGFMVVDRIALTYDIPVDRKGFQSLHGKGILGASRLILMKPQTFMNRSGEAVREVAAYFRISPCDILVIYDDVDLPFGRLRIRAGGGSGGHRGMRSIISTLGTDQFPRVRIGIGRPEGDDVSGYVLSTFTGDEREVLDKVVGRVADAVEIICVRGIGEAMDRFNERNDVIVQQYNGGE
ncbi:MAG: aminoacyl-tRNA hydrolase [Thermodesulfobacteriota bacterium]